MRRERTFYIIAIMAIAALSFGPGLMASSHRAQDQTDARLTDLENRVDMLEAAVYGTVIANPTPTVVPEPTATAEPTATPVPDSGSTLGWHAPMAHDGLNGHEHGDEPPAWVLASENQPFTQDRESHTGYKGVYAVKNNVESYLIAHIISTAFARAHGDHDYQFWVRDPDDGAVYYWSGLLDFGTPPPLRTTDTGERPIILSVNDGGCETWYGRPGALVFDLGWTICGRYEKFDGTVLGGVGTFRTADWILMADRLPADHGLQDNFLTEFGVKRLSWIVNSKDYSDPVIAPIN